MVTIAEKGVDAFSEAENFYLVNAFPWLKYLPSWLPGASFKKKAKRGYQNSMRMYKTPYEITKEKLVSEIVREASIIHNIP